MREYYVASRQGSLFNKKEALAADDSDLLLTRSTAHWYADLFKPHEALMKYAECEIALTTVFLAFKAADFIPGVGRIKMNQLMEAYGRVMGRTLHERETARLIEKVCEIEMQVMCLSGFDFEPIH